MYTHYFMTCLFRISPRVHAWAVRRQHRRLNRILSELLELRGITKNDQGPSA